MAEALGASQEQLRCVVVTPEDTVVDQPARFVALPLYDGELGVAPLRQPLVGRLGYGQLRIRHDGRTDSYYVDGGFVEVADNVVSILTSRAVPAEKIDVEEVQQQLQAVAARKTTDAETTEQKHQAMRRLQAQLRVAQKGRTG